MTNDTREFKINLRADEADDALISTAPGPEAPKNPFKKSLVVAFFFAIAVVLIAVGLYYHLNKQIQAINARGSAGIASLSEETSAKLLEFGTQLSDQKNLFQQKLDDADARLKKINAAVAAVQTGKPDKKETDAAIAKITSSLEPLRQSIADWEGKLAKISEEARILTEALDKTRSEVSRLQKEIVGFSETYVDRTFFAQEMKNEREFNQQNMAHASETLFSEISALSRQFKEMEKKLDLLSVTPASSKGAKNKAAAPPEKTPSLDSVKPGPGQIIEQDISPPTQSQP